MFIDYHLTLSVVFTQDSEESRKTWKDNSFLHGTPQSKECDMTLCSLNVLPCFREIQGKYEWHKMKANRRCLLMAEFQAKTLGKAAGKTHCKRGRSRGRGGGRRREGEEEREEDHA